MTNWEYLLGTPALAAQFVHKVVMCACYMEDGGCEICPLRDLECCMDFQEVKAWLESEMG